jgi:hypothetical protein
VQVELENGNQLVLPLWMFDEEVCKSMVVRVFSASMRDDR